jgi:hypothetical protein
MLTTMHSSTCVVEDLFVQVQSSSATIKKMLTMLKDASFLDDYSNVLRGRFITYNHPSEAFATVTLELVRGTDGAFHGQVRHFNQY